MTAQHPWRLTGWKRERTRRLIFARDSHRCSERLPGCTAGDRALLELGHIKAIKACSTEAEFNHPDNLQTECRNCNRKKGDSGWTDPNTGHRDWTQTQ